MVFLLALIASLAHAAGGAWLVESDPVGERSVAQTMETAARKAGWKARVVKRFRLGVGWEFVTLVGGFADEAAATAAAKAMTSATQQPFHLVGDAPSGAKRPEATPAPAAARTASDYLAMARLTHGGPDGGVAAMARSEALHFVFRREFELDRRQVAVVHEYWRDTSGRRISVRPTGFGQASLSVASPDGAWVQANGQSETRDIGVVVTQADAFAPEVVLGMALDVHSLLAEPEWQPYVLLEGAESGVRIGRGEDPAEPGLAFVDIHESSGQLLRVRYISDAGPLTYEARNWAAVAPGILAPGELTVERADGSREIIVVEKLELLSAVPAGTFTRP